MSLIVDGEIHQNDGTGWALLSTSGRTGPGGLTGFPGGSLVRYGDATARCGIEFVDSEGNDSCAAAIPSAADVYVVHDTLAFAGQANQLFIYEGEHWMGVPSPGSGTWISKVWASESTLLLATNVGAYVSRGNDVPTLQELPLSEESAGAAYTAAWGFSDEELWIGNSAGELFHRRGQRWSLEWRSDSPAGCRAITGMWGDDRQLFVTTMDSVYTLSRGARARRLAHRPCDPEGRGRIWSIWGNSAEEVFVAEQTRTAAVPCGTVELTWFDGTQWSRL